MITVLSIGMVILTIWCVLLSKDLMRMSDNLKVVRNNIRDNEDDLEKILVELYTKLFPIPYKFGDKVLTIDSYDSLDWEEGIFKGPAPSNTKDIKIEEFHSGPKIMDYRYFIIEINSKLVIRRLDYIKFPS